MTAFWAALFISWTQTAPGVQRQILHGHVPAAIKSLVAVESLPGSIRLNLSLGLPLRNQEALTNLLVQLYDPSSPLYHHYLSPQEFTDRFGPTEQDYQTLIAFVQAKGLVVTGIHSNRLLLDVYGGGPDIEAAFATRLRVYSHPRENRKFFAPEAEPSVEPGVPILDISGLDNYLMPHPTSLRPQPASQPIVPNAGSAPGGSYRGNDFRAAYLPGGSLSGAGQVIGLLEFDGYYTNDITTYETQAGLPNVTLQNVLLNGFNGSPGANNAEVALDIEVAIAIAPGVSSVRVYEGSSPNTLLNRMATENVAKQLSSSWTYGINGTTENIFRQFGTQGQSMFQASGDDGAYSGAVPTPADDPNITIVGGTTLTTSGPGGAWVSERTWNWANTGSGSSATGGGVSTTYAIPNYQSGISMGSNQGSTTLRNLPDVAMTADNIWVVWDNGSQGAFGGTSAATPLWAAFMALVNQQAVAIGQATMGFVNPALYTIAKGSSYASAFHDITIGNNTNSSSPTRFLAVAGYDLCTGWGTPAGQGLINALTGGTNFPPTFNSNPFTEPTVNVGQPYSGSISNQASDANPADPLTFAKVSGPAWLSLASDGSLSGTPLNANVGTNTFTVSVTEASGLSNTATMYLNVNGAPIFNSNPFTQPDVNAGQSYLRSIATKVTDPNPGDTKTFAKVAGAAWLTIAPAGAISGTPANADAGTNTFTVSVTDSGGLSNTAAMFINVNGSPTFASNPFAEPTVNAGTPYSGSLSTQATDPNPSDTVTFAKAGGPAWLSIAANGTLSGTPANGNVGTNTFTVTVTDSGGLSSSATMFLNVNGPPSFGASPFTEPGINVGQSYASSISGQATDPNPGDALTFAKISGPAWLGVSAGGTLFGTPANADAGANSFTVSVSDSAGLSGSATMLINVNGAPSFSANPLIVATAAVGQTYVGSIANQASDPNPGDTLSFAKVSGPAWLNVAANGGLSGAPANADVGTNAFIVSATDPGGLSSSATLLINVDAAPTFISNPLLEPGVNVGQAYAGSLTNQVADPNAGDTLTFAKISGPAWLSVAANGALAGTPAGSDAGTNAFSVSVTDSGGLSNTATMLLKVNGPPTFAPNPFTAPGVSVGQSYAGSITNQATDPNSGDTLTFAKIIGPAWLSVAVSGSLSGVPANGDIGTNAFSVSVTDSGGLSNTATMLINVNGPPAFASNSFSEPAVNVGQPYAGSISNQASDPNPGDTLSFAKVSGPAWLSVAANGALSGTPAKADVGTNAFNVSVTDSGGLSNTATMLINVNGAPAFASNSFAELAVNVGQPYAGSISSQASDPNPGDTLSFAKVSGPAWLSVAANGALSGTPANADVGTNAFNVGVTDSGGLSNTATMFINVNGAPAFAANSFTEPTVNVGQPYSGSISNQASDPNPGDTLNFVKISGPAWLSVAANGALSGTPANADVGTNMFSVSVSDLGGLSGSAAMVIYVNGAPSFNAVAFNGPTANVGQAYSISITNRVADPNPADTLSFTKVAGPAWLNIAPNGTLSGVPANTDIGTNAFSVSVTDSGALSANATIYIEVNGAPTFIANPITVPAVSVGQAYSGSITNQASDPNPGATLTFSKLSGPAWLVVAPNGSLSGTPANSDVGTNTFNVRVTDSGGLASSAMMKVPVMPAATAIQLQISLQTNVLAFSWTGGNPPFQLQVSTNLVSGNWQNVGSLVTNFSLIVAPGGSSAAYRIQGSAP